MLSRVPPESNVHGVLQVRDILLELDGVPIGNDGTIQLPGTHDLVRVTFSYLVYRCPRGHPLKLTVLRQHERLEFTVPVRVAYALAPPVASSLALFPPVRLSLPLSLSLPQAMPQPELLLVCKQPLPKPSYLIVGGLVFVPLMSPYEALIPRRKLDDVLKKPSTDGAQIVCLLMILRAEVNVGYEEQVGQLASLNGEPVKSLRGLKEQVEAIATGPLCFRLDSGEMIVMDSAKCWQSEAHIFRNHRITSRASSDLV